MQHRFHPDTWYTASLSTIAQNEAISGSGPGGPSAAGAGASRGSGGMYVMGTDRKPWSTQETRALISLRDEMKGKFQTMKRNRALWVELSEKLRKHFGHERTASQCAVRWKNIMAAYKDSREGLKNAGGDATRICAFFKEVEAVLGDPPLNLPQGEYVREVQSVQRDQLRRRDGGVLSLLMELRTAVAVQGQAIARIEKMLMKERGVEGFVVEGGGLLAGDGVGEGEAEAETQVVVGEGEDNGVVASGVDGGGVEAAAGENGIEGAAGVNGVEGTELENEGEGAGVENGVEGGAVEGSVDNTAEGREVSGVAEGVTEGADEPVAKKARVDGARF